VEGGVYEGDGRFGGVVTQLERATAARKKLLDLFPQIVQAKNELQCVLDEAQNVPPLGEADGSISETKWKQLSLVANYITRLIASLLFWSDE
jgi:hypothetical protein